MDVAATVGALPTKNLLWWPCSVQCTQSYIEIRCGAPISIKSSFAAAAAVTIVIERVIFSPDR